MRHHDSTVGSGEDDGNNTYQVTENLINVTFSKPIHINVSSVESQKGVIHIQWRSTEKQKGAIAVQSLWR